MIIGIDFDNTLACYDNLFFEQAVSQKLLSDDFLSLGKQDKTSVRNYLRSIAKEEEFTKIQGYIYGEGIKNAKIFEDALSVLKQLSEKAAKLYIVSHKTQFPYLGPKYNLHECASGWLHQNGFFNDELFGKEDVFFETTKEAKLQRVASLQCTHFIDDLPEILNHPLFPKQTEGLLFDPQKVHRDNSCKTFTTWQEIASYF